ncbi:MAG: hypothetical protein JWO59_2839, partial [Chloroflexi bacterium]|nr:hypothetical protein [Chloroflexota bacterium]
RLGGVSSGGSRLIGASAYFGPSLPEHDRIGSDYNKLDAYRLDSLRTEATGTLQ